MSSMQSYYAARAPEYDRVYQKPERQTALAVVAQWLPPHFVDKRVLEVACGTGYWTQYIAPVATGIVAIDTSPETMAIAKTRVPANKVSFLTGDAYDLPGDQGLFDAAFAGFWFSHVPRRKQSEFLHGLHSALLPGATVLLLDNLYIPGSNHPVSAIDADGNIYQNRKLDDGSEHRVLKNFPSEDELHTLVKDIGENILYTQFEYYWALSYTVK